MHESSGPSRIDLTPQTIKSLAHPLRLALLGLLRTEGPATSSELARLLDTTSGATSYHLRQLERGGFIEDVPDMGTAKQRYWRASHETTNMDRSRMGGDIEATILADEISRMHSRWREADVSLWIESQERWGDEWTDASADDDMELDLTAAELADLVGDIRELISGRLRDSAEAGGERVRVHLIAYPVEDSGAAVKELIGGPGA